MECRWRSLAECDEKSAADKESTACIPATLTSDNVHFTLRIVACTPMIRSIKHRGLKRLYERGDRSGIPPDLADAVEDILGRLDESEIPQAMDRPGYRLHPLKGDLKGFWSVTVRANWRIIFRFEGADAFDVELTDYH